MGTWVELGGRKIIQKLSVALVGVLASVIFTGTVSHAGSNTSIVTVDTTSLPSGVAGQDYPHVTLTASGGKAPYKYSANGLPNGLELNNITGLISGKPTKAGNFSVWVTATDSTTWQKGGPFHSASKKLTLTVSAPDVVIETVALPPAEINKPYNFRLTAAGGQHPYRFTGVLGGNFWQAGISLKPDGTLSGTPTKAGTYTSTIVAFDSTPSVDGGPYKSKPRTFELVVIKKSTCISPPCGHLAMR